MNDKLDTSRRGAPRRITQWGWDDIAGAVDGRLASSPAAESPVGVSTDTRTLEFGELFVALQGPNFDGHDFVSEAREKGASGAIVATGADLDGEETTFPLIRVDNTLEALQQLGAALWREADREGLYTVAITGSNGKTTTKELAAALASTCGRVHKTSGNLNNHIGLPLTLCDLPAHCDHLIVEMGANAPGEIAKLIGMAPGDARVITSIGLDHPEGFGTLDGVRRAKAEIAHSADEETALVVPASEREAVVPANYPGDVWTFGPEAEARVRICESSELPGALDAQRVTLEFEDERWELRLGLPGPHNASNLAAASATLLARGASIEPESWSEALRDIDLPGGRWRRLDLEGFRMVDDAYNANPASVRASLDAFVDLDVEDAPSPTRIAVLGEMDELGDRSETLHRKVAGEMAVRDALDALVFQGPHAEIMVERAREVDTSLDVRALQTHEAIADWIEQRRPAFVWLKASRRAELECVVDVLEQRYARQD